MAKTKNIIKLEKALHGDRFRPGAELVALIAEGKSVDPSEINENLKMTAAEIAWLKIVQIARGGSDSIALEASKFIIERTFGKSTPQVDAAKLTDGTLIVRIS